MFEDNRILFLLKLFLDHKLCGPSFIKYLLSRSSSSQMNYFTTFAFSRNISLSKHYDSHTFSSRHFRIPSDVLYLSVKFDSQIKSTLSVSSLFTRKFIYGYRLIPRLIRLQTGVGTSIRS